VLEKRKREKVVRNCALPRKISHNKNSQVPLWYYVPATQEKMARQLKTKRRMCV